MNRLNKTDVFTLMKVFLVCILICEGDLFVQKPIIRNNSRYTKTSN